MTTYTTRLAAICLAGALIVPAVARAQLNVAVGAGAVLKPTYEGSNRSVATGLPLINVNWHDMISLADDGLSAYLHLSFFSVGAGLTFDPGRDDHNTNGLVTTGDDRLAGMGKIKPSVGYKGFSSLALGPIDLGGSITKFIGADSGILVGANASSRLMLTRGLSVTPHVSAMWANRTYMATYFGVSAAQASSSRFAQYTAGEGWKNVGTGLTVTYAFGRHWFVSADGEGEELQGSAAKSPLVMSKTNAVVTTVLGYHF